MRREGIEYEQAGNYALIDISLLPTQTKKGGMAHLPFPPNGGREVLRRRRYDKPNTALWIIPTHPYRVTP